MNHNIWIVCMKVYLQIFKIFVQKQNKKVKKRYTERECEPYKEGPQWVKSALTQETNIFCLLCHKVINDNNK